MYIPDISARRAAPSGLVRPSGAAAPSQVGKVQAILSWLDYLPHSRNVITGRQDAATKAAVRAFQIAYNAENRCRRHEPGAPCQTGRVYGAALQPASLDVDDGTIGPQVIAAAQNYNASAAAGGYGLGITAAEIAAVTAAAPSIDAAEGATKPPSTGIAPIPSMPSTPAVTPPTQQTASKFPTGPVVAVGVGIAVIGLAVAYKRSQRKGR